MGSEWSCGLASSHGVVCSNLGASQPVDINTWMQDQNAVLPTYDPNDPDQCLANPVWSFSSAAGARGTQRLRIYLRGGTELAWFRLAHGI